MSALDDVRHALDYARSHYIKGPFKLLVDSDLYRVLVGEGMDPEELVISDTIPISCSPTAPKEPRVLAPIRGNGPRDRWGRMI